MLDSLVIKNFRCLEDFRVERLGRLNLIVGGNNSGKSTVLEALRIYAGNANRSLLLDLAHGHDETYRLNPADAADDDADFEAPLQDFFSGRRLPSSPAQGITIGSAEPDAQPLSLQLQYQSVVEEVVEVEQSDGTTRRRTAIRLQLHSDPDATQVQGTLTPALTIKRGEETLDVLVLDESLTQRSATVSRWQRKRLDTGRAMNCQMVSTQLAPHNELGADLDKVTLGPLEAEVHAALRLIERRFQNLAFVQSDEEVPSSRRRPIVKLEGERRPVPLASLGEGMRRVLQIILKLVNARDGLLLIDEFENGLHYSVQPKVWAMLFDLAEKLNVQVFATTHSWDCIKAFAEVAKAKQDVEGVLFRMGRSVRTSNKGQVIATVYDEDELFDVTQADLEVR